MDDSSCKTMGNVSSETKDHSSGETRGDSSGETMGDLSEHEQINMKDVSKYIEEHGMSGIEEFLNTQLERWKDVEINIGVTGDPGVGKSSFINAIRGLNDDDENAAETGVKETTMKATKYPHPTNSKIMFWDLPGIGTPSHPTLETYCEKVELMKCDTFLICAANRFTVNDWLLAEKVKSLKKSFFFIRTHIDKDRRSEKRKRAFNEKAMLNVIRQDCLENLKKLRDGDEVVFLISNHHPAKWDFARLTQAILDVLPFRQRECLTLSLGLLISSSKDILKRKVAILRGRIWMVAAASGAVVPVPGLSVALDLALLTKEFNMYKSQLGLPKENSYEFRRMTPGIQAKVLKFCLTSAVQIINLFAVYSASSAVEEGTRYIPFVGSAIAGSISFSSTYYFLHKCLNELEETAVAFLDMTNTRVVDDYVNN